MATTNDLKNGMVLNLDGQLWSVIWFQHHKPGKGGAVGPELGHPDPVGVLGRGADEVLETVRVRTEHARRLEEVVPQFVTASGLGDELADEAVGHGREA